jgi:hypothetical protein
VPIILAGEGALPQSHAGSLRQHRAMTLPRRVLHPKDRKLFGRWASAVAAIYCVLFVATGIVVAHNWPQPPRALSSLNGGHIQTSQSPVQP